jgi:hypothetical protein
MTVNQFFALIRENIYSKISELHDNYSLFLGNFKADIKHIGNTEISDIATALATVLIVFLLARMVIKWWYYNPYDWTLQPKNTKK